MAFANMQVSELWPLVFLLFFFQGNSLVLSLLCYLALYCVQLA